MDSKGPWIIPNVGTLWTLPGTRLRQIGIELSPEVGVREVSEEVSMGGERLVAELAVGLNVLAETVLWHLLEKVEDELVRHPVVEGHVEAVLLDDLAADRGTLERRDLGHAREELLLEVNLGEVSKVFGHSFGLDRADGAVVGGGVRTGGERLVEAGLQVGDSVAFACR